MKRDFEELDDIQQKIQTIPDELPILPVRDAVRPGEHQPLVVGLHLPEHRAAAEHERRHPQPDEPPHQKPDRGWPPALYLSGHLRSSIASARP